MRQMTDEEIREFLSEGTRTGKLAVTRHDGSPHVTPIWFVLDGDDIVFNTSADTVKVRSLASEPRVAMAVDDQAPPYSFVMVEGTVSVSDDLDEMLPISTRIGGRYMGADRAEEFGRRNAVEGELLVRLTPTKYVSRANMAG